MKKIKIICVIIIVALIILMGVQNQEYFIQKNPIGFNFYFLDYTIPETANGIYWVVCFATGFLLSYFSSLMFRFKTNRKIKLHNQTIENYRETVEELKKEIEKIKADGYLNMDKRPETDEETQQLETSEEIEAQVEDKS